MEVTTRFAPSPTGRLHLGHAYSAWLSWQRARAAGGRFLLRIEDIDAARSSIASAIGILDDLRWLGFGWDGEVRVQSAQLPEYQTALERLQALGVVYPCFCSRSDIARATAAPHGGDLKYPGTCRALTPDERRARLAAYRDTNYAWRLDAGLALGQVADFGFYEEDIGWIDGDARRLDDVVLARRDLPASYHLCVVHDDAAQGVSHVHRGRDLFEATHTHVLLQRLLGLHTPTYAHHALLTDASGQRLAKRNQPLSLQGMRRAGESPRALLERLHELHLQNQSR